MIGDKRPAKTNGFSLGDDSAQAFNEIIPVLINLRISAGARFREL
jgi:hypothetical protein